MQHFRVCGPSWLQTVSVRIFETLEVAFGPPGDAGWNSDPVRCPPIVNKWRKVKSGLGFKSFTKHIAVCHKRGRGRVGLEAGASTERKLVPESPMPKLPSTPRGGPACPVTQMLLFPIYA